MSIKVLLYIAIFIFGLICGISYHFETPYEKEGVFDAKEFIEKNGMIGFKCAGVDMLFSEKGSGRKKFTVRGSNIYFTKEGNIKIVNAELTQYREDGKTVKSRFKSKDATIEYGGEQ